MEFTVQQLLAKIGQLVLLLDAANARIAELERAAQGKAPAGP